MQIQADQLAALINDTIGHIENPGPATMLRVLEVKAGSKVTVKGIVLENGKAVTPPVKAAALGALEDGGNSCGGVLLNAGEVTLENVEVRGGVALNGGGICNLDGAKLTLRNTVVRNNNANEVDSGADGGGIFNGVGSVLMLEGGSIKENAASSGGGGIFNNQGTLTMTGTVIEGNTTTLPNAGAGGGVFNLNGTFTLMSGSIRNNTVGYYGGGLTNYYETSYPTPTVFVMKGGSIEGNKAA